MEIKVTKDLIDSKIKSVEYVKHITASGKIFRWCIITLENGFSVSGKPSACVVIANDNQDIGEQIAYKNAYDNLWELEGYLSQEQLYKQ